MLFFVRLWYRLTMAWTRWRKPTAHVPTAERASDIPARILYGDDYRKDPRWVDFMAHPQCFQARLDAGEKTYDCEDHALYWATVLSKSHLVSKVGLGFVYWRSQAGKREAHAICVFEDIHGNRHWADYRQPHTISASAPWWSYGHDVLAIYGGKSLRKIAYLQITGRKSDDTPIFRGEHLVKRRGF